MPIPPNDVAHLYRRAGFGLGLADQQALSNRSVEQLVDGLLNAPATRPARPAEFDRASLSDWEKFVGLQHWWYDRMATTTSPLSEKMTLFWHGHFCSGRDKVDSHEHLWQQNELFRSQALGNFRALTKAVSLQPAMLQYLDNVSNRKGKPQENFARELWELFMLGSNNYSQEEVLASARAWTGYGLTRDRTAYEFHADQHDGGPKTIFGLTRNFDGPEIVDLTLDHLEKGLVAARFIAAKLWAFFAYENPDPALVDHLAIILRRANWELKPLLRAIFLHPEFWSVRSRQGRLRSPIEMVVAMARSIGTTSAELHPEWFDDAMGQIPFNPPDVAGWKLNDAWISSSALWGRARFVQDNGWRLWGQDGGPLHPRRPADLHTDPDPIGRMFEYFGISRQAVSAPTRIALDRWLLAQRNAENKPEYAWKTFLNWNLFTLVLLSAEFQMA